MSMAAQRMHRIIQREWVRLAEVDAELRTARVELVSECGYESWTPQVRARIEAWADAGPSGGLEWYSWRAAVRAWREVQRLSGIRERVERRVERNVRRAAALA